MIEIGQNIKEQRSSAANVAMRCLDSVSKILIQ